MEIVTEKAQTLSQIISEGVQLEHQIAELGGELTPELEEQLANNEMALEKKVDNYGYVVKSLEAEVAKYEQWADELQLKAKIRKNSIKRILGHIKFCMDQAEMKKVEGQYCKATIAKPRDKVQVTDIDKLPERFIRIERSPIKTSIMNEYKNTGQPPEGASIVQGESSLKIKVA